MENDQGHRQGKCDAIFHSTAATTTMTYCGYAQMKGICRA